MANGKPMLPRGTRPTKGAGRQGKGRGTRSTVKGTGMPAHARGRKPAVAAAVRSVKAS